MFLYSTQPSLFSFYVVPNSGKLKGTLVHYLMFWIDVSDVEALQLLADVVESPALFQAVRNLAHVTDLVVS